MKNILLPVHDDVGQEARFQAALDVTRAMEGHLTCVDVVAFPAIGIGAYWGGYGPAIALEDERAIETANRSQLEQRLAVEGIPWSWIDLTGDPTSLIHKAAKLNELIVVNRNTSGLFPDRRTLATDLVVLSGKPVLAVPEQASGFATGGKALVAWDGSAEVAKAIQAAVPLLRLADQVTILEIEDGSVDIPAEEAGSFLSRYDIHARVARISGKRRGAAELLYQEVSSRLFDYVVMGGFGHSRIGEALLGGVTRTMLTKSPVPLFLTH